MKIKHLVVSSLVALALVGCQQKKSTDTVPPDSAKRAADDAAKGPSAGEAGSAVKDASAAMAAGMNTLSGVVKWEGKAPKREPIEREADPVCAREEMLDEETLVTDGKLANVVVTIVGQGLPAAAPSGDIDLNQKSCMYRPRVQCGAVGQKVVLTNGDSTMHNIHGYKNQGKKSWFNQAQMGGSPPVKKTMKTEGITAFKCDIHPWMAGYVYAIKSGSCAVSAQDGSFSLQGLPAGTWTVTTWHEVYGEKSSEVTIEDGKPATFEITYSAADKAS